MRVYLSTVSPVGRARVVRRSGPLYEPEAFDSRRNGGSTDQRMTEYSGFKTSSIGTAPVHPYRRGLQHAVGHPTIATPTDSGSATSR